MTTAMTPLLRRRTLVVSVLPVPDGGTAPVTGLGMRAWGLAKGLAAHGHEVEVLVLSDDTRALFTHDGLSVTTEPHHPDWERVLAGFGAVVVLYCSDAAHEITGVVAPEVVVVLDVYVPWYVENAARRSTDVRREYGRYLEDAARWNEVLVRGDIFLCASTTQQHFYLGVLSALGGVNPVTYDRLQVLEVPFGIDPRPVAPPDLIDPYRALGIPEGAFVLLWFGAIYPWFDIDPVLRAVQELTAESDDVHFVVVGGRNPWMFDDDYERGYARARHVLAPQEGTQAHFLDWVAYEERLAWYACADVLVSLNTPGLENLYSWRTRLADYIAAAKPVISNGGDPLGEQILAAGGAFRVSDRAEDLAEVVRGLRARPELLVRASTALAAMRDQFSWRETTACLAGALEAFPASYAVEEAFVRQHHLTRRLARPQGAELKLLSAAHLVGRVRAEGAHGTVEVLWDRLAPRVAHLRARLRGRISPNQAIGGRA